MTRSEHLQWCKDRALEYLDRGDLQHAFASMVSGMSKHEETDIPILKALVPLGILYVTEGDTPGLRRWIEGFR